MSDFNEDASPCYYCGEAADSVDHVVPQSLVDAAMNSGEAALFAALNDRRRRMTVPCCHECNGLAGWKYHQTLEERAAYVRRRLAHRHRKVLEMPDWASSELMELSEQLRNLVLARLIKRDEIRRRLRYRAAGALPINDELRELARTINASSAGRAEIPPSTLPGAELSSVEPASNLGPV
jgi:DNA-binding NarL/FixJ family response regulator